MQHCDLLIIGGGPAGLAASVFASSEGLSVTVIDKAPRFGGQAGTSAKIVNYLGFPNGISGEQLTKRAEKQARNLGATFMHGKVKHIQGDATTGIKYVQMADGTVLTCRSLLIAIGVQYRQLDIPGLNQFGVFYGANPNEAAKWKGKTVAIVGGANSAGQAAVHFAHHADKVYMLSRSPLEAKMSAYLINEIRALHNIEVKEGFELGAVGKGLELVEKGAQIGIGVDGVFIFIGAEPKTDWLPLTTDPKGFILTGSAAKMFQGRDPYPLETSILGVFAAGDVRAGSLKRVTSAAADGAAVVAEVHQYLKELNSATSGE